MVKKSLAAVAVALMFNGFAQAADANSAGAAAEAASAATSTAASTSPSDAESDADARAATWAAQGQLGLIITSANSTTKSGNASFDAAHRMGRWTLSGGFGVLYASTGHYSTQQDTNARLQADLELSPRTFWFSTARWDRNLFTGFAYQESVASGGGFKFIQSPSTLLAGELGAGYRIEKPETLTIGPLGNVESRVRVPGYVKRDAVLQAGLNYSHSITESTKVVNTLLVQYGATDTTTTDNLSLQVKVDASLSLAVGMQLVNNTSPPAASVSSPGGSVGAKHTDTVVTVNLVYALKNKDLPANGGAPLGVAGFNLP